jgi:hypothetical protein
MSASEEVDNATGQAPAKENVIELLKEKRAAQLADRERYAVAKQMRDEDEMAAVRHRIDARKEIILALEIDAAVVIEATGQREAQARLLAIKRAYGSTVASYQDDEARVRQAVAALKEAITTLNSRARKLEVLRAEAAGLADRFSLTVPTLTMVSEPERDVDLSLPPFWRLRVLRPSFEDCEHNLRQRRDYTEIAGTPGYAVIQTAGLKPWRELTEREREVLEDREQERKPDPVLAQAAVEALGLSNLGVPGGGVHRG